VQLRVNGCFGFSEPEVELRLFEALAPRPRVQNPARAGYISGPIEIWDE
jgi:hypothetical protein